MKTFQEFQEQMLSAADRKDIRVAGLKAAVRQRVRDSAWQRRHAYHEIEAKNSREDRYRMSHDDETQPA
jgi:polyribonucleotide nucleotidyltransferase